MRFAFLLCTMWAVPSYSQDIAVIVSSNDGQELSRPQLKYADDDGARYYQLFSSVLGKDNVYLLTSFDEDTAKLFPRLKSTKPTKANLARTLREVKSKLKRTGGKGQLYFIFAGHGDVRGGQGFLQLEGSQLSSKDISNLLKDIPYRRAHIILDSCNSYFALFPRKPGGRRFVASSEAFSSNITIPNAGVILSTSADDEVYEWSGIQAGIFSYTVRSALLGAGDANKDGAISYGELHAFIETATKSVPNPAFRPKTFVRSPSGKSTETLMALPSQERSVEAKAGKINRLVDHHGIPIGEVHAEVAFLPRLRLPTDAANYSMHVRDTSGHKQSFGIERGPDSQSLTLVKNSNRVSGRNIASSLNKLFAVPFGPSIMADFKSAAPIAPTLGIGRKQLARMDLLLKHTAELDRQQRDVQAVIGGLAGLSVAGIGAWQISSETSIAGDNKTVGWLLLGAGAGLAGYAGYQFFSEAEGEGIYKRFRRNRNALHFDELAMLEKRLFQLAERDRKLRYRGAVGLGVLALGAGGFEIWNELANDDRPEEQRLLRYVLTPIAISAGVGSILLLNQQTPIERMVNMWREEPNLNLTVSPTIGGGYLSLSGRF